MPVSSDHSWSVINLVVPDPVGMQSASTAQTSGHAVARAPHAALRSHAALPQAWQMGPAPGNMRRRQSRDQADDLLGSGMRSLNSALEVPEQVLASVDTAQIIEARHVETVGMHVEVVRDDDARHGGIGLVKHAQLPQIFNALLELPSALVQVARIEVTEPHAPRAIRLLDPDQARLDIPTIPGIDGLAPDPLARHLKDLQDV
eukprot:CAMPEP_0115465556 /NCGR_PEP_ID=MMETSP0271-20121206/49462_1 /TAXON_ID=71861 /ORGANISM="Scrippsiella trochoidea, Strain CCMP3099" /LENGTH=202 /DNA_ID=CAMNT_0002892501 /DNA_START=432 /DNA_END=1041 /DNA_ORIENTATION=+